MIGFGMLQILLSQIPNFHKLTYLSTAAAIASFGYAFIGSGLSLAVVVSGRIFTNPKTFQHNICTNFCSGLLLPYYEDFISTINRRIL